MKGLVFGEVLWDIYPENMYIGGAPFNFAAHFEKCGGKSYIVTAVGKDESGEKTIEEIEKNGVDTKYVQYVDYETGKCLVALDENSIPSYKLLENVAYDYIRKPELNGEKFDVLYFGTLSLRSDNNRKVLKQILSEGSFEEVFVDVNIRPPFYSKETIVFALENATILKISDEELPTVISLLDENNAEIKECVSTIAQKFRNIKMIIITKGENGSECFNLKNGTSYKCEPKKVTVASTVGAGDSFSASFMARYSENKSILDCLEFASKVSAYVVSQTGAVPDYDIKDFG